MLFEGAFSYFVSDSASVYFPQIPFVLGTCFVALAIGFALFIPRAELAVPLADIASSETPSKLNGGAGTAEFQQHADAADATELR